MSEDAGATGTEPTGTDPASTNPAGTEPMSTEPRQGHSRRTLLTGLGAAAVAGTAGWALRGVGPAGPAAPAPSGGTTTASAPADAVAGITFPAVPQRHLRTLVLALTGADARGVLETARSVAAVDPAVTPDAGEVTVTIAFSPAVARELWPERASLAAELPAFAGDVDGILTGGDLVLQVCAETAAAVNDVSAQLLGAAGASPLWERTGYRDAPTPEGTARTSTGFVDGIINPRTTELRDAGVWTGGEHRDTHLVVRRMTIAPSFLDLGAAVQEAAIGRRRDTGAPLSGGGPMDEVDLFSKGADGTPLTPIGAHARRAHPVNIGRPLMLRRSYGFDVGVGADGAPGGAGLLFVAFLSDPQTFVATQQRLDELDELIAHTTTDASGCFFVPEPGTWL